MAWASMIMMYMIRQVHNIVSLNNRQQQIHAHYAIRRPRSTGKLVRCTHESVLTVTLTHKRIDPYSKKHGLTILTQGL